MHELHLAQTIINTALSTLKNQKGRKITKIEVAIDQNDHIEPEAFKTLLEDLAGDIPNFKNCLFKVQNDIKTYIKEIEIEK